jgi:hypothetical protein
MTSPKSDDKAADKAEEKPKPGGKKGDICVPCFAGVWPVGGHAATCEHGTWSRDQQVAEDEAEKARAEEKAAADAEAARQSVRQQGS